MQQNRQQMAWKRLECNTKLQKQSWLWQTLANRLLSCIHKIENWSRQLNRERVQPIWKRSEYVQVFQMASCHLPKVFRAFFFIYILYASWSSFTFWYSTYWLPFFMVTTKMPPNKLCQNSLRIRWNKFAEPSKFLLKEKE